MPLDRDVTITYLGHATALIETPEGRRLLLDPFTTHNPRCPDEWKQAERFGRLDAVLLTHVHNDHAQDAQSILAAYPDATVIAIAEACDWLASKGAKNVRGMNKGGSQSVADVRVTMTHADHSSSFVEDDGKVIYGGEAAGYVLRFSNGFTVYAAGDTALFGDMALIRDRHRPDLALLPIGDLYTMGPEDAAVAARMLGVKHVIPIHYGTFPALTGTVHAFRQAARDLPDLNVHALQPGESLR